MVMTQQSSKEIQEALLSTSGREQYMFLIESSIEPIFELKKSAILENRSGNTQLAVEILKKSMLKWPDASVHFFDVLVQYEAECPSIFDFAKKIFKSVKKNEEFYSTYIDILFYANYISKSLAIAKTAHKNLPNSFECAWKLGRAYLYLGDAESASKILRKCFEIPLGESIWWIRYLAMAEHFLGNNEAAINIYKQVIAKYPKHLPWVFRELVTYIPEAPEVTTFAEQILKTVHDETIYSSLLYNSKSWFEGDHAELLRKRLSVMIDALSVQPIPLTQLEKNYSNMVFEQAWLFDQNINDRILRKKLATLYMRCNSDITAFSTTFLELKEKKRLRVGIALTRIDTLDHSSNIVTLLKEFDTSKFELILFTNTCFNNNKDSAYLYSLFSKVIFLDMTDWREYKRLLLQEELDIYMAENIIGSTLPLAFFSRFAPIQINMRDRLDSFGAPHTDYFLIFGEKGNITEWSQYVEEKYAVLNQNYVAPLPGRASIGKVDYAALGLPDAPFFFFSQWIQRFLTQDDCIISKLLEDNPDHYFFWLTSSCFSRLVWYRWKKVMPQYVDRIRCIHYPQPLPIFLALLSDASAVLGPISSSHGSLSSSTAFSLGVPTVTGFGSHWGSCITKFQYSQMGVEGLVASSHEEYIAIAQRLVDDPIWKAQKSHEIRENFHKIYNPSIAAQEIQDFLFQSYERACSGLKPEHWEHGYFIDAEKKEPR